MVDALRWQRRAKARDLVRQGINPAQHRQLERIKREQENATTFKAVAKEWLALKDWADITKTKRLDMLQRVVFPKIGPWPIKSITPAHILDVLTTSAKKNGLTVAAEAKRSMSGIFELAVSTLRADTDPVYPVRAKMMQQWADMLDVWILGKINITPLSRSANR
jgi:hypothetical protein